MSRIDDLTRELCPTGVEAKPLGEIATLIRGNGMPKAVLTDAGVGAIHYGQIYTRYGVWTTSTFSHVAPVTAAKLAKADPGDIIITNTSENIEDVGKAVAWLGAEPIVTGGHATIIKHRQDPKFLSYWFQSASFFAQKKALATGTKVIDVSAKQLAKVQVPVPPLEVQREIVRILDHFTKLEAELEVELEAELEARCCQYEHYRRDLLSFESGIEWAALSDVADYANGKAHERLANADGDIPMVTARFISRNGEANRFVRREDIQTPANAGDTALVLSDLPNGRALARTFYISRDNSYAINQRVARVRVRDANRVAPRFLYYVLDRNPGLLKHDNGVDQTHLSKGAVTGLRIPIPTLSEQLKVVAVLDRFDGLVSDLSVGLAAELAARRKQYEYYRDKLLTFKELPA